MHEQLRLVLPGYEHTVFDVRVLTTPTSKFAHWFHPRGLDDLPELTRLRCNDSAYLVSCAPRTRAELATLLCEAWLAEQPWSGSDIKVMTLRRGPRLEVTIRVPALVGQPGSPAHSGEFRAHLIEAETALTALLSRCAPDLHISVGCNSTEHPAETGPLSGDYVTVSGSALDFGEDGLTGRGNGRHGLITPAHGDGVEATAGKNPTYHVGKVGAWLADQAAALLAAEYGQARLGLAWRIGTRFDEPALIHLLTDAGEFLHPGWEQVREILAAHVDPGVWLPDLLDGERYRPCPAPSSAWAQRLRGTHA